MPWLSVVFVPYPFPHPCDWGTMVAAYVESLSGPGRGVKAAGQRVLITVEFGFR